MRRITLASGLLLVPLLSGTVEAQDRRPDFPPPTIVDYRPVSTLRVPQHPVPRARFPAIDFHGHPPRLTSSDVVARVVAAMDSLNLAIEIQADPSSGRDLTGQMDVVRAAGQAQRFFFFAALDLRDVGPGSGARIARQLEEDVEAGAVGVGEIMKSFGLSIRKADGSRLRIDDPELDIVWETAGRLGVPVFIHTGDPASFFQPLDYSNERWLEMALFANRRLYDRAQYPSFDELMAERDRVIARHPETTWVVAHMSWYANDLERLDDLLQRFPNVYTEVGAVLYDIGRQPRAARAFFERWQDRILFGKDAFTPSEYPYYWRVFETADEYFDYYRDYHAFWKLYGIELPDGVLRKVYHDNALHVVPRMAAALAGR